MTSTAQQRRDEAGLLLVGRGLLEGLVAGAAMGPLVLLLMGLVAFVASPSPGRAGGDLAAALMFGIYAAIYAAPFGLAGGLLALVALGLVAHRKRGSWTTAPTAWLVPAITIGVATAVAGVVVGWLAFYAAALPAAALTAWRVRRAIDRYAAARATT